MRKHMKILQIDADTPQPECIAEAAKVIRIGGVIACPTDTVYGLLCDPMNKDTVQRIYDIKGRDFGKPLILLVAEQDDVGRYASDVPESARKAMHHFWPGALTVILPAGQAAPQSILAGGDTIGFRMPNHELVLALIRAVGFPLASTSANRSGQLSVSTAQDVVAALENTIDMVIDGGATPLGMESTIVDFTVPTRFLREGSIPREEVVRVIGEDVS
jgi:L-threonylcarbamoyladenylate synthase